MSALYILGLQTGETRVIWSHFDVCAAKNDQKLSYFQNQMFSFHCWGVLMKFQTVVEILLEQVAWYLEKFLVLSFDFDLSSLVKYSRFRQVMETKMAP